LETNDRLTKRNLWAFSLGPIGRDTATYLFSGFLLTYVLYTKTLSDLQFTVLSAIVVVERVFDAVNDLIMGNVLEITRTKWGKFKPWIAVSMILCGIIYLISFGNKVQGWPYVVLFGILYLLYDLVFTANDIAYWGMIPALAVHKEDRDRITSLSILFAGIGSALTTVFVPMLTAGERTIGGSAVTAYWYVALACTAMFIGTQCITLIGVKEKPLPPKGEGTVDKVGVRVILNIMRENDQLKWCTILFMFSTVATNLFNNGLGINYIFFEFGYDGLLFTLFSALGAVASAVIMLFFTPISKKFSRNQLMKLSTIGMVGGNLFILLVGLLVPASIMLLQKPEISLKFALMMFGNLFAFAGQSINYLVIVICIANTVEYNEWKTGARAEGIIFAIRPFIVKLGYAFIQLIVLVVFLATGVREYTNQIADLENAASRQLLDTDAKTKSIERVLAAVPPGKNTALLACMTIIPIVLSTICYLIYVKKYTLTEERYEQILLELKERKALAAE